MSIPRSLRLTFNVKKKGIELERMRVVNMRSPVTDTTHNISMDSIGCRVEVINKQGDILYSRRCQPFVESFREAYTGDPNEPFEISTQKIERETLSIVVPIVENAHQVVLREICASKKDKTKKSAGRSKPIVNDICVVDLDKNHEQGDLYNGHK